MIGISLRQFDGCQQAIVEGQGDKSLLLPIDLCEQAGRIALENALDATFW